MTPGKIDVSLFKLNAMSASITAGIPHQASFAAYDSSGNLGFLIPSYNTSALGAFKQLWRTIGTLQSLSDFTWRATYVPSGSNITANISLALAGIHGTVNVVYNLFQAGEYSVAVQYKGKVSVTVTVACRQGTCCGM